MPSPSVEVSARSSYGIPYAHFALGRQAPFRYAGAPLELAAPAAISAA